MKHSEHRLALFFGHGCLLAVNIVEIMGVTHAASGIVGKIVVPGAMTENFKRILSKF